MPKTINLTGTNGKTYNLDEIQNTNTRLDSESSLVVQIWKWNPTLPEENPHSKPNPDNLVLGQMWLSKFVETNSDDYKELASIKVKR